MPIDRRDSRSREVPSGVRVHLPSNSIHWDERDIHFNTIDIHISSASELSGYSNWHTHGDGADSALTKQISC